MIVKEIHGDMMKMFHKGEIGIIAQGCNCFGVMGAGLARQVSTMYPEALAVDRGLNAEGEMEEPMGNYNRLGTYSKVELPNGQIILNCYTQFYPGANFEYRALIEVLLKIGEEFAGQTVAFPEIGCEIGGGQWNVVKQLIEEHSTNVNVLIVHYDNGIKTVGETTTDPGSEV
jgi:O-acetyl-ADP-ribose deacetylase (regulator of RNase III)